MPVFAAIDSHVFGVQYAVGGDFNWVHVSRFDNHIILRHGERPYTYTVYGHLLRRSVKVKEGQWVAARTQIELTASSGNSSGPHLHFTIHDSGQVLEPFAGACRPGASGWSQQPRIDRATYVGNVSLSAKAFRGRLDIPHDEAERSGTFVRGRRDVFVRIELRHWSGGSGRLAVRRPTARSQPNFPSRRRTIATAGRSAAPSGPLAARPLDARLHVDGASLAEVPFDVVATARAIRNRPPNAITRRSSPPPHGGRVVVCKVATSLVTEDPDYELVRYLYRWTSGRASSAR